MAEKKQNYSGHILIIEDDDSLSALLERELSKHGFVVTIARDGKTGLEQALNNKPDLVLLDMMLPKLNGLGVLEALNKEKVIPALPVVVISNSGQPVEVNKTKELGARDTLVKINFSPAEVTEKVCSILNAKTGTASDGADTSKNSAGEGKKEDAAPVRQMQNAGNEEGGIEENLSSGINVLLVEDDPFLAGMLERKLKEQKFTVHHTVNVEDARKILKENDINIICLDLILPGADGFTLLEEVKSDEKLKKIPVLILSNLGQQSDLDKAKALGAADYAIKANTSPNAIVKRVKELLA